MNKGKVIIFSGPSGVGKDTVRALLDDELLNLGYSVSMTTRSPREGETNGKEYHFVSKEDFEKAISQNDLLEYTEYVGNYYGTPYAEIERLTSLGKNVLLEIEVNGARQVLEKIPEAVSIFLLPPSKEELERRIRNRNSEPDEVISRRLEQSLAELAAQNLYSHHVVNVIPEQAAREVTEIILNG